MRASDDAQCGAGCGCAVPSVVRDGWNSVSVTAPAPFPANLMKGQRRKFACFPANLVYSSANGGGAMASHRGAVKVPKYNDFHWPVIRALKETGGSASIAELYERVVADMNLGG
jgi:hypothetical protein